MKLTKVKFMRIQIGQTFSLRGQVYRKSGALIGHLLYHKTRHVFYPMDVVTVKVVSQGGSHANN